MYVPDFLSAGLEFRHNFDPELWITFLREQRNQRRDYLARVIGMRLVI
jgi:hypothetical protein